MTGPTLADYVSLFAFLVAGCTSDRPAVDAWPALGLYAERPDLPAKLAAIDAEASAAKLELIREVDTQGEAGTRYVVRSYRGLDLLGRETWACRVASPLGVVLALGPGERSVASEVVFEADAGEGHLFASPGQLIAGGEPELLLRRHDGALRVWSLAPRGASPIEIDLSPAPTGVRTLPTGEVVLVAEIATPPGSGAPLYLLTAAGFAGGRFTSKADSANRFHAEREALFAIVPEGETMAARLDRMTSRAFHAIRAGADRKAVARELSQQDVAPELRETLRARSAWLEKL